MLKATGSTGSAISPKETKGKAGGNNIVGSIEATNQTNPTKGKKQAKMTKSKNLVKSKNHDFPPNSRNRKAETGFFTFKARLAFIQLKQMFIKTPIFIHFDPECHIRIKINASDYAIGDVLS